MPPPASSRLPWIDHLRTFVIFLVVAQHACVTYSHVGDWYAKSATEPTLAQKIPFILWQGHAQAFFLGLLFFVSAYFAHASLSRRGPAAFIRERLIRLGLPTLLYMLVIDPFIVLGLNPWNTHFPPLLTYYHDYLISGRFIGNSGPLWFAFALLIFCLALVAWRSLRPAAPPAAPASAPSAGALGLFGAVLVLTTFATRLAQPIGTNVLNMQLCFFPQYIAFFVAGLHASRHRWMASLASSSRARIAGWFALIGGPILLLATLFFGVPADGNLAVFFGGWTPQAFGFAVWEQFTGLGLSLGLLALFSAKLNFETPVLRWLADRSFGVYVLHAPVLVALFMFFRALPQNPFFLATLLTLTGLLASYLVAELARRLPGLRSIL